MGLPDFDLKLPESVEEVLALLGGPQPPLLMAGGTDLLIQLRTGSVGASPIVGLSRIGALSEILPGPGGGLSIGGATRAAQIEADATIRAHYPGLLDAALTMATPQIRNRATVAGNLVTAAACADFCPVLVALGAEVVLLSRGGQRRVPLARFLTGARQTLLAPNELLRSIELPMPAPSCSSAYEKFGYRRGAQIAVASAAAWLRKEGGAIAEIRLVLGSVAPVPLSVEGVSGLVGHAPEGGPLDRACEAASRECKPISDIRGSEEYRRHIAGAVARRAILRAWDRSQGTSRAGGN